MRKVLCLCILALLLPVSATCLAQDNTARARVSIRVTVVSSDNGAITVTNVIQSSGNSLPWEKWVEKIDSRSNVLVPKERKVEEPAGK